MSRSANHESPQASHCGRLEGLLMRLSGMGQAIASCGVERIEAASGASALSSMKPLLAARSLVVVLGLAASGGAYGSGSNDPDAGDLRLVGGSTSSEGRVEIYHDGQWGTICDDYWDSKDGDVACHQLGYPAGSEAVFNNAHFGRGPELSPIWLDNVRCSGTEASLLDCLNNPGSLSIGVHNCFHGEDAGVRCNTGLSMAVRPSRVTVNEEDATGSSYEVVLLAQPTDTVTVTVSGTSGTKVTATPSTLTFTTVNWDTPQSVTVMAAADANNRNEEVTLTHRINSGGYDSVLTKDVWVAVQDNDPGVSVRPPAVTVMEEDTAGSSYEVVLRTQPSDPVTVTVSGTSGTEVTATPSTLTFTTANWDTAQRVTVTAGADANKQSETVTLVHSARGGGYGSVSIEEVSVTVRDNDPPSAGDVRLVGGRSLSEGRVEIYHSGQWGTVCDDYWDRKDGDVACRQLGYPAGSEAVFGSAHFGRGPNTSPIWLDNVRCSGSEARLLDCLNNPGSRPIGVHNCFHSEDAGVRCNTDSRGITVRPSEVTVSEEDATGSSYEVVLRTQPTDTVTVTVSGTSGTAVTATPSTLTFTTTNWNTAQRVTVKAAADANNQDETVTLTHRASGGGYGSVSIEEVSVTVRDNDPGVSVSPSRVTVSEEDTTGSSYEVVLRTQPTDTVTVTVSGTSGTEVTATPSTLTFTTVNWDTPRSVAVTARADANEQNEEVTLTHRASGGGYGSVSIEEVSVTVRDNDVSAGDLRLVGGESPSEGRVEIYHAGQWGTICDDYWDSNDGDVACHQLGYPAGSEAVFGNAHFGRGPELSPIWLDDVQCSGSEARLLDCLNNPRRPIGTHNCFHGEDAGVRCDTSVVPSISLSVEPVAGETTELSVSWEAVTGAEKYRVKWKVGTDAFNDGEETTDTSYTISGLTAGTTYTVEVAAIDTGTGSDVSLARNEADGTTHAAALSTITVYHDLAGATGRYDTAVGLLDAAGWSYTARTVTGTGEVDRLAGVSGSVLPRFFLGDPEEEGWGPSEPGVNNGGLRWLRSVLASTPAVSIAAGPAVDEGTEAAFTVTLSVAAPVGGLTLGYRVSEDGDFVASSDEGAKTLAIDGGATSATLDVPTAGDDDDEPDGTVTVTLTAGAGYTLGSASSAAVTVRDDDDAAVLPAITIYHDAAGATGRYDTAVGLLTAAGRSYTVRFVTGTGEVDRLAGVSGSVLPRFFLGDPEDAGWGPSEPGVNNGGLRWLRSQLAAQGRSQASSAPVAAVSVADASAQESSGSIAFTVTLSAASGESVSVDWATSDGTAVAGTDYTAASGGLTFAPGETSKAVTVTILDDAHDEGTETFTLTLSNPRPVGRATLADATATGSISNADPLQKDWLARFGRAAASDAVAAVTARLEVPRDAGSHLTVGGQRFAFDGAGGEGGLPPTPAGGPGGTDWLSWSGDSSGDGERTLSGRELLLGTSFRAVLGRGAGVQWTGWGQGASVSQFSSAGPGLSLSGEAATGSLGMDYEGGRLLAGFAMTHSLGEGTARGAGRSYALGSAVTTMLPYARFALSERVSAWGLAGTGSGRLTLDLDGGASERYGTDLSMTLAAAGVRGELVAPAEASGFALALKADALWVRTESEGVSAPGIGNLAGARADASRLRAVLDGSRRFALTGGRALTPSVELGLRHDGGDAETGTGFELGAGVGYADPSRGLDMALRVQGLAAHADDGYGEWSVSGSLRLEPGGAGRGLSMSLTPSYGATPGGSERLWTLPDAHALAVNDDAPLSSRLDAEVGYGMVVFGGGFTGTPHVGLGLSDTAREYRMGWRLSPAGAAGDFSFRLDAARRDSTGDTPEHRVGFGIAARW